MAKVLRIINRLNLGGPTYNAAYLSKYLAPDFETLLVAGMKDESEESSEFIAENLGLQPIYISHMHRSLNPIKDRKAYLQIVKIIREFKPDIVHTHAAKAGALGRLAAINEGVPIVLHTFHGHVFHSYFNPVKTKVFLTIEKYLAKKSSKTIAISQKQFEELCLGFKIDQEKKFEIIPLGFDLDRFSENIVYKRNTFRNKYHLAPNEIAIGIIGRLVPVKNHSFFLNAFKQAKEKTNKTIKAVIIGDGELRKQIEQEAEALGLNYSTQNGENIDIIFTSWIKAIDTALPGLEIVALTSLNEGTPVSLIEAQAAGIPIISTRVGGIEDVVLENKTALLAETNQIEEFTHKLIQLIEDESLRNDFSNAGPANVSEKFSYQRLVNDMKILYTQLLNDKGILIK
jgi:glycosyltransferase involved in cell wall biosynthesis